MHKHASCYKVISSAESQKGVNAVQRYYIENRKGAIDITLYSDSALLVLKRISLNTINALLAMLGKASLYSIDVSGNDRHILLFLLQEM